jgi:hypothetical protein
VLSAELLLDFITTDDYVFSAAPGAKSDNRILWSAPSSAIPGLIFAADYLSRLTNIPLLSTIDLFGLGVAPLIAIAAFIGTVQSLKHQDHTTEGPLTSEENEGARIARRLRELNQPSLAPSSTLHDVNRIFGQAA